MRTPRLGVRRQASLLALEVRAEALKLLRLPVFLAPTIGFPCVFYLLFGVLLNRGAQWGAISASSYLLATYAAFGVIGAALFALGTGVAAERGQGWMLLRRVLPTPVWVHLAARIVASLGMALLVVLALFAVAGSLGGVRLETGIWLRLCGVLVLGAAPFTALGLALGWLAGPNSAPVIANLLLLPASFASGLWLPIQILPGFVQNLAPWLPPYHLGQLALGVVGVEPRTAPATSIAALIAWAAVALALATWAQRRDEGRTWG